MKFGGRVYFMCLSWLIVETSGYDSPWTNQGPFWRILSFFGQKHCLGSVHPRGELTERMWIEGVSIPYFHKHLYIFANGPFGTVSELSYGCAARKG